MPPRFVLSLRSAGSELESDAEAEDPRVDDLGDLAKAALPGVSVFTEGCVGVEEVEDVHHQAESAVFLQPDDFLDTQVE